MLARHLQYIVFASALLSATPVSAALVTLDPNDFSDEADLTDVGIGVVLSSPIQVAIAFGTFLPPAVIGRLNRETGSGGCCWRTTDELRVDFDVPTDFASVGFFRGAGVTGNLWTGFGIVDAFDSTGALIETTSTPLMRQVDGLFEVAVEFSRPSADLDYLMIREDTLSGFTGIRVARISFEVIPIPEAGCGMLVALALAVLAGRKTAERTKGEPLE